MDEKKKMTLSFSSICAQFLYKTLVQVIILASIIWLLSFGLSSWSCFNSSDLTTTTKFNDNILRDSEKNINKLNNFHIEISKFVNHHEVLNQISGQINGTNFKLNNESSRQVRKKRTNERGRPILNEFSFPANLVQGMRYVLMCQVLDGEPPIQIKWFKDNLDLHSALLQLNDQQQNTQTGGSTATMRQESSMSLDQIEMQSNDELSSSLLFRKVKQQHGGNYTCLATNYLGTSAYSSLMTVKVPPNWRIEPKDQEAIMGELVTIDCQASGNPNPFIRWKFTSVQHDKTWQHSTPDSFTLQQQQHQSSQFTGDPITTSSVPLSTITNNNFKLINSNHHVQTLENGSLTIRQTGPEHEGLYLCEADNGVEPNLVKQIRLVVHRQAHFLDDIQVHLQDHPSGTSSVVTSTATNSGQQQQQQQSSMGTQTAQIAPIKSIKLAQNSTLVRLICMPYGDAPLQLDWLKDGRLIHTHSSNGPTPSSSSAISSGIIDHQATATSSMATSSLSSSAAADQQHLSQTMGRYHVNTRWLSSNLIQKFLPTTQHQQQQQQLLQHQHSMGSSGTNGLESELLLTNLARHDAGLYTCAARNAFGQSERKLRIIVQEQPEPPAMVDVAHISSRFISLRWLAPFDGNSAITKYVIEYRKQRVLESSRDLPTTSMATSSTSNDEFASEMFAVSRSEKIMPGSSSTAMKQSAPFGSLDQQQQQSAAIQLTTGGAQIQHTVHDLEPMTRYSMRVIAVNALGASRPSISLSLRTEEEVPATVPTLVEANVLSSRSIKIRWTISYPLEHELIDGFFIGYRSFDSSLGPTTTGDTSQRSPPPGDSISGLGAGKGAQVERPTFTYKTIRLTNQQQISSSGGGSGETVQDLEMRSHITPMLSPISSVTKTVAIDTLQATGNNHHQQQQILIDSIKSPNSNQQAAASGDVAYVISNFEYVIGGLERNTEYTVLIQCFNKKGAGPSSDAIVAKTLMSDPPEKLTLIGEDLSETSLRLSWQFRGESTARLLLMPVLATPSASTIGLGTPANPVDGFVLTFAKLAPLHGGGGGKLNHRKLGVPDSAARISQQSPSNNNSNNQHLYSAPIQPSQIVDQQWHTIQLAPQQRQHVLKNLECGTLYGLKIWAFNQIGKGEPSDLVTLSTRGKAPVPPARRSLLIINSTDVRLHLNTWYDGGCDIDKYSIKYRPRSRQIRTEDWTLVSDNISREQQQGGSNGNIVIRDLLPATTYELLVGAQNHVGQTEAKYRFTTHDTDGKPVTRSSSFLGVGGNNGDDDDDDDNNDEDNDQPIDYLDDLGTIREQYKSRGGGGGGDSGLQVYHSSIGNGTGTRWLLIIRQILNSPLTLLLAFCLFLILLVLLVFHRFSASSASSQSSSSSSARFGGPHQLNGNGGGGATNNHKSNCSVDGNELPMSMANSSPQLTDSPATRVNLASTNSRSNYAPLDSFYAPTHNSFCQQQPATIPSSQLVVESNENTYQQQQQQSHNCQPDNYAPLPVSDCYSPAVGGYAPGGVHRSATMTDTTVDHSLVLANSHDQDDQRQQYLMQMLMMSPQQQQPHNCHDSMSATMARPHHHNPNYSMTAAALTTLVRHGHQKSLKPMSNYSDSMFQVNNLTLNRQMQAQPPPPLPAAAATTFQHTDNVNAETNTTTTSTTTNVDEAYPMSTFSSQLRISGSQQQQQDLFTTYGNYSKETTANSLNNSVTSTSGCGTGAGTSSTTSHLGGLSDILELQSPCCELEENLVQLDDNSTKDFQIQTKCDKPIVETTTATATSMANYSQYDVPFKFKATIDRNQC